MELVGTISSILKNKTGNVWKISPDATVFEAIKLMADKDIGALLVTEGEKLLGVVSERDYARKVAIKGRSSKETLVREILPNPIIYATPDHTVGECMRIMTEKRVRHLPVLKSEQIMGVVSIGDLVNWTISTQSETISQLENYIAGQYPG